MEEALNEATGEARGSGDRRSELRAAIGLRFLRVFMPAEQAEDDPPDAEIIEELERLGDDLGLARAWRVFSEAHVGACRWQARGDALERALVHARRLPERRSEASAIAALLVQALHFGPTPGSEVASRCRDLLAAAGQDLALQAGLKATFGAVLATQGQLDEARTTYADSAAIHDELGLRVRRAVGTLFGAEIEMLADDPAAAESELLRGYKTLEAMGETGARSVLAAYLAEALWRQGRADEASSYAEIAAEIAEPGDVAAQTLQRVTMARALVERDATESAETVALEAVELASETDFLALQAAAAHVARRRSGRVGARTRKRAATSSERTPSTRRRRTSSPPSASPRACHICRPRLRVGSPTGRSGRMSVFEQHGTSNDDYRGKVFVGVGHADSYSEAKEQAVQNAWAGSGLSGPKVLRVAEEWVGGENPITWCKVVLSGN